MTTNRPDRLSEFPAARATGAKIERISDHRKPQSVDGNDMSTTQTAFPAPQPEFLPTHDARELTNGGKQASIQLDDKIYTLRITRAGKLILTK